MTERYVLMILVCMLTLLIHIPLGHSVYSCICDVVIINVKDEINTSMRNTLEICAKSRTLLHSNKMP
jgi:hypothetical protein